MIVVPPPEQLTLATILWLLGRAGRNMKSNAMSVTPNHVGSAGAFKASSAGQVSTYQGGLGRCRVRRDH